MGRLKILADGHSIQARAQARGQLFENLMAQVLRHYGFSIDRKPNVNYAGMEIDIEGKSIATGIPLYAECKCYETEIDAPKLRAFYGTYMARWLKDKRSQGLFIALPGINSHAKGFYRDNCEGHSEITVRLMEEKQVIEAIFQTPNVADLKVISGKIGAHLGTAGDWLLLYTDKGLFWIQYVIPPGSGISSDIALFDSAGISLTDKGTIDYLIQLYPELKDFNKIDVGRTTTERLSTASEDVEEIVQVRGSSECFEYQFPASPEYFVGRQSPLNEFDAFIGKVLDEETSSRGILFESNSGWGKSSVVLSSVARLNAAGHFALAIDCRSASSSQFILRVANYAFNAFGSFNNLISEDDKPKTITGFEGAVQTFLRIGCALKQNRKVLVIFLDQFENIFYLPETLKSIVDLLLKICDSQANLVLGFAWKTDLIGLHTEFPYQLRDSITSVSNRIQLEPFTEVETTALLKKLREELKAPLRKDLTFFLSEFSQGYPWLLKKLCAHVKSQREAGVPQAEMANGLLNIEELFQEDLRGLAAEEEEALRGIAKAAPISVSEFGEELKPEVVQSLVHRRLVVKIGHKFDIYWDIFRDYLNTGKLPAQENYILRAPIGSILKAINILSKISHALTVVEFRKRVGLTEKSIYNMLRDMRLLGLVKINNGKVEIQVTSLKDEKEFKDSLRVYLRDRLRRNRLVLQILEQLEDTELLSMNAVSITIAESSPYIFASDVTWKTYARTFADWMDFADLAIFDGKDAVLTPYKPSTEVRGRRIFLDKRRAGLTIPNVQYSPIEKTAIRIVQAFKSGGKVNWSGLKKSTLNKSLAALEDLGLIVRKPHAITVLQKVIDFVDNENMRSTVLAEGALKQEAFAAFIEILKAYSVKGTSLSQLATELTQKLEADWQHSTAETNVKIMLDWARHAKLAPGVFAHSRRGRQKGKETREETSIPLFPNDNS